VDAARRLYPSPSSLEFADALAHDLEKGMDGHSSRDKRTDDLKKRVMAQYGVSRLEDLPVAFEGIALQESEEWGYILFDKHYGRLWKTFDRQEQVQRLAGIFAPLLSVRAISMGMAETDRRAHQDFARAAESYRRTLIQIINDDIKNNAKTGDTSYKNGRQLWERVPPFKYRARELNTVLAAHGGDFGLLLFGFVAACLLTGWSVRTMKVLAP
jgi:ABC-2 type transport system permease protein